MMRSLWTRLLTDADLKGEIWKIEDAIHPLIKLCTKILSDDPLFFLVNSYTTGLAPAVLTYMLATELKPWKGNVESQEIGLPVTESQMDWCCLAGLLAGGVPPGRIRIWGILISLHLFSLSGTQSAGGQWGSLSGGHFGVGRVARRGSTRS